MNDIVKKVAEKAGISEAVAQIAVTTVVSALKKKLPANVSGILDSLVSGDGGGKSASDALSSLGNVVGGLGNLLKKK